jgi:RNA polymerase sigma-70 factor (ECF subfamily)
MRGIARESDSMQAYPASERESWSSMDDVIHQEQRGEVAEFEALYRRHVGRVYAICKRISGDPARAEDLAQEVFLKAWKHRDSARPGDEYTGWICRVAINVAISDSRSRGRRSKRETLVADPATWDPADRPVSPGLGLDLEKAIDTLPPGARNVFVLHDVEGYRHREIGTLLGLSTGTTKAQLHRARRILREALSK